MLTSNVRTLSPILSLLSAAVLTTACGQDPAVGSGVTLKSGAFGASAAQIEAGLVDPAALVSTSGFSFCITQLKLEGESGEAVVGDDGSELIEARLGLVDLGTGASATTWGSLDLPAGAVVKKLKIEIHRDPEVCGGADYSMKFDGAELTRDIELTFAFPAGKTLNPGDSVALDLASIAAQFESAKAAGKFNNEQISSYLEGLEGSAEKEE